jgi:dUTPase
MFKVLSKGCEPTRGSKYSACVDLYAAEDVTIGAGETKLIGLGVAIDENEIEKICKILFHSKNHNYFGFYEMKDMFFKANYLQLMLRSSLGKKGLILPNGVGIIDLDYKDEIKMIIHNPLKQDSIVSYQDGTVGIDIHTDQFAIIKKGDKIAQITLLEHKGYLFGIDTEEERDGGFGSTGERR